MPWVTSPPRTRLRRLWGQWKRWEYDHGAELLPVRIGLFVVGCVVVLALLVPFLKI
jgi:hypothetical protein